MVDLILLTADEVLFKGLYLVGFNEKRQNRVVKKKNLSRFRTHYGSGPSVYALLLEMLQTTYIQDARVDDYIKKVGRDKFIDYFFMAINLLCCYPTENEAEADFPNAQVGPCERTWRQWTWDIVLKIGFLKPEVI